METHTETGVADVSIRNLPKNFTAAVGYLQAKLP